MYQNRKQNEESNVQNNFINTDSSLHTSHFAWGQGPQGVVPCHLGLLLTILVIIVMVLIMATIVTELFLDTY